MQKRILPVLLFVFISFLGADASAQAPAEFNFQGLARNNKGEPIVAKSIALRFTIRTERVDGAIAYRESRSVQTDSSGVFNAVIGGAGAQDATGRLSEVVWNTGNKFLQVEIDTANGIMFKDMGATQLLSVPFAMFSNNASYAESSHYARSSGAYFFEAVFGKKEDIRLPDGHQQLIIPNTIYNHLNPLTGKPVYDSLTGTFAAPEAGIYQFDLSIDVDSQVEDLYLRRNDKVLQYNLKNNGEIQQFRLKLNQGDKISIWYWARRDIGYVTIWNENDSDDVPAEDLYRNFFSGYKIY